MMQGVLAVLLPTEDLENACLRTLVGEILAETVLGNGIGGRLCEGWFLWESITRVLEAVRPDAVVRDTDAEANAAEEAHLEQAGERLERFGLLESPQQKQALKAAPMQSKTEVEDAPGRNTGVRLAKVAAGFSLSSMSAALLQAMRWLFLALAWVRVVVVSLATASTLPSRTSGETPSIKRPLLAMRVWRMMSSLLELDTRMPWLTGALCLGQWLSIAGPGRLGRSDGAVDR